MRTNNITLLIGTRNTGKTITAKKIIKSYFERGMRILVIDTLDHPAYKAIERIKPSEIENFAGIKRIYGSETEYILTSCENYYNGLLVIEDATKYVGKTLPENVRKILYDCKQKNVDILFIFHNFMGCPPELWRNADILLLKRTGDTPESRKGDMPSYNEVLRAYNEIQKSDNKYITKCVKLQ